MAVSGAMLYGFVLVHTLGNLKVYQGADTLDPYAEWLREVGAPLFGHSELLWMARIGLLVSVVVHLVAALQLTRMSQAARPAKYVRVQRLESTYASRTIRWGGVILGAFILFHLLDLTFGVTNPEFVPGSVYRNVVTSLRVPAVSAVYIIGMILLGLHMYHGLWSGLQTLGFNKRLYEYSIRGVAAVIALGVALINMSIPIAILVGLIR